jgi:hypothetical protein
MHQRPQKLQCQRSPKSAVRHASDLLAEQFGATGALQITLLRCQTSVLTRGAGSRISHQHGGSWGGHAFGGDPVGVRDKTVRDRIGRGGAEVTRFLPNQPGAPSLSAKSFRRRVARAMSVLFRRQRERNQRVADR